MIEDYDAYEHKQKKSLAEDSFRICIGDFGKRLLYPMNAKGFDDFDYLLNKEAEALRGKEGSFIISNGIEKKYISFSVNLNNTPKTIKLFLKKKADSLEGFDQEVEIEEDVVTFGIRSFFKCSCGKNATVFYMPHGRNSFSCRECSNVGYESQRLNRHTMQGLFYYSSRLLKLFEAREGMGRMFYGGKLSRRGKKLFDRYDKLSKDINIETRNKAEEHLLSVMSGHRKSFGEEIEQFI